MDLSFRVIKSLKERISAFDDQSSTADARKTWLWIWSTDVLPVLLRMLLSSQMKEIASNKGEKVQPQVCVPGLSQRKFSVNDLQVQENCSHEPISGRGGWRFSSDTGEKVQVTKLRAIMAKAVFNPKKTEDHYSSVISDKKKSLLECELWTHKVICTLQYTL